MRTKLFSPSDRSIQNVSKTMQNTHIPSALQQLAPLRIPDSKQAMRNSNGNSHSVNVAKIKNSPSVRKSVQIRPSLSKDLRDSLQNYDLPPQRKRIQQFINVEPLSSPTHNRKTSTCMTMNKNPAEVDAGASTNIQSEL